MKGVDKREHAVVDLSKRKRPRVTMPRLPKEVREKFAVKQEFKNEVNINTIVARLRNGQNPPAWMTSKTPHFGDFVGMPTNFQDAYAVVERAEESFAALPVEFRREIDNDPRRLFDAPRELFEKHGLIRQPDGAEASQKPQGRVVSQRVEGDTGSPSKGPTGPNKGRKAVSEPEGVED